MAERPILSDETPNANATTRQDANPSALDPKQRGWLTGQSLGGYQLQTLLGIGGMADVYLAYDTNLQREVAIKALAGPLAQDASYTDHFRKEARRVAALSHPHLAPVYQAGEAEVEGHRILFLVMPLLTGSLHDLLKDQGRLPYAEVGWLVA